MCTGTTCTSVTARSVVLREVYVIFQSDHISGEPEETLNTGTALTCIGFISAVSVWLWLIYVDIREVRI